MKNNGRMETLEYMGVNFLAEDVIRNKISNLKNRKTSQEDILSM